MVRLKVFLFAQVREWFQQRNIELILNGNEWSSSESFKLVLIKELENELSIRNGSPKVDKLSDIMSPNSLMLVINEEMIETTSAITLQDDDIVTLVPPVSGG